MTEKVLDDAALDVLFREARSFSHWQDRAVSDEQLQAVYDLMKMGPTAANSCPARIVFVKSAQAKEKLEPCLNEGNVHKSMQAPAVAIIAMDMKFHEKLPYLFSHTDARSWYEGKPEKIADNAYRSSTLQGAYLMLAARALGLDCGPMTGFNRNKLNETFFPDGQWQGNFICALGYGDRGKLYPRHPRLSFDEAARIE